MRQRSLALVLVLAAPAAAQQYTVRLLPTDAGTGFEGPRRIRHGAEVCGLGLLPGGGDPRPVRWNPGGTSVLPLLPGDEAGEANGFNDLGLVVGTSSDIVPMGTLIQIFDHAAFWQDGQVGAVADLVTSGPALDLKYAVDCDVAGRIVGVGRDDSIPALRGWILENGVLTDLGSITPTGSVSPADLNESGQIAGTAEADGGRDHAFLWQNGVLTDLHVSGGVPGVTSQASAVNEAGVVVGRAEFTPGGPQWEQAAMWTGAGVVQLPDLGGNESWATGINAQGDVVGGAVRPDFALRATLWRGGVLHDLNDLIPAGSGWILLIARDISDDGRIVGEGAFGGATRGFVLEPICESCTSYCTSTPNSTGLPALLSATGWESVAADDFGLEAAPVPAGQPGLFYYGPDAAQVPFGNGFRCVGPGGLGFFRLPVTSATGNVLATDVPLPDATSGAPILPGSTWRFQAWFRDPAAGGANFDLSDGLEVTFLP